MESRLAKYVLISGTLIAITLTSCTAAILRVAPESSPARTTRDGTSWNTAYALVEDALDQAATGVVGWTSNGTTAGVTRTGLSLAGMTSYFSAKARDSVGNRSGTGVSDGIVAKVSAPQIAISADGGSYSMATNELCFKWSIVDESTLASSYYAIGTSSGGTEITGTWSGNINGWISKKPDNPLFIYDRDNTTNMPITLPLDQTYYISVKATDSANRYSVATASVTVVDEADRVDPHAPTGLTATAVTNSSSQANLSWTDNSNDETGFYVERSAYEIDYSGNYRPPYPARGPYVQVGTVTANTTQFVDTGLLAKSKYAYRVVAFKNTTTGQQRGYYSALATVITNGATSQNIPARFMATAISSTQVVLNWVNPAFNTSMLYLGVDRRLDGGVWTPLGAHGPTVQAREYDYDAGLEANTLYHYRIQAKSWAPNSAESKYAYADVTTPPAPSPSNGLPGILEKLTSGHPRVMVTTAQITQLKRCIDHQDVDYDATFDNWYHAIKDRLDYMCGLPEPITDYSGGNNIDGLRRITALAAIYLLSDDSKYAERAIEEMEAAAADPLGTHWGPQDFNKSYRAMALGLGYDWLYSYNSTEHPNWRYDVTTAITTHGFSRDERWVLDETYNRGSFNHCLQGYLVAVAAVAIGDVSGCGNISSEVIAKSIGGMRQALHSFDATGACADGYYYYYFNYAPIAYLSCAFDTALGLHVDQGDIGLGLLKMINHESPYNTGATALDDGWKVGDGIRDMGLSGLYLDSPLAAGFNFGDGPSTLRNYAEFYYFGQRYPTDISDYIGSQVLAWRENQLPRYIWHNDCALDLFWYTPTTNNDGPAEHGAKAALPLAKQFKGRGIDLVSVRSAWEDPDAAAFIVRGGNANTASHNHADLGHYIFDASGFRWAEDLGYPAAYDNMWDTSYWRWQAYRVRTESHNTLVLDSQNQMVKGEVPLTLDQSTDKNVVEVEAKLTEAYADQASDVHRVISLVHGNRLAIRDRVTLKYCADIVTGITTPSEVDGSGQTLEFSQTREGPVSGSYYARLLYPAGVSWTHGAVSMSEPENGTTLTGIHNRVYAKLTGQQANTPVEIAYVLAPSQQGDVTAPRDVTDLTVSQTTSTSVTLTWTAPGNDGASGTATTYDIRYSASLITGLAAWGAIGRGQSTIKCTGVPTPASAGNTETFTVSGLVSGHTYRFVIRAGDGDSNWSWLSNCCSATLP